MYYRNIETNASAKAAHDKAMKAASAKRLAANAAWNKAHGKKVKKS